MAIICTYCSQPITETKYKTHKKQRYHFECFAKLQGDAEVVQTKIKTGQRSGDAVGLNKYICELFGVETLPYVINKQIDDYTKQLHYSYSGIQKTLEYFYKIKENEVDTERVTIGIVPYVYEEAEEFYRMVFDANAINDGFDIQEQTNAVCINPKNRDIPCYTKIEDL